MKLVRIGNNGGDQYLEFDNGSRLEYYHEQDCCENVYADFEGMQVATPAPGNYVSSEELDFFDDILDSVVPINGLGFYIVTKQGICILVSCYNIQNGYYNSSIELVCGDRRKDISGCTEDEIYA